MIELRDMRLGLDGDLRAECARKLRVPERDVLEVRLLRRSVDARKKNDVHFTVSAAVSLRGSEKGYSPYVPWTPPKVEVLRERLLDINPAAHIEARHEIYTRETADDFQLDAYDYIIDAIDSLEHKCHLILHACRMPGRLFSSMGAALKMDPTASQVDEFWKVTGCPLARATR